ncbi:MAG: hypothetical protein IPH82_04380 [Chloroflexi bacterium]|nr:hypothetical protein [Chloroflexota bacterium]
MDRGLGCALENLIVAARATGFTLEVTYPDMADFINVQLTADTLETPLFKAIPLRAKYPFRIRWAAGGSHRPGPDSIPTLEPGIGVRLIRKPAALEAVVDYVNQDDLSQYTDPSFIDELIYWLRFNKKDALATLDGLYSRCSGNPEVPGWLGRMFVAGTKPQQQADIDAAKLRSSPGAIVILPEGRRQKRLGAPGQV